MDKMRGHKNCQTVSVKFAIFTSVLHPCIIVARKEVMDVTKSERFEQLDRLLTEHDGMLQTAQVIASGLKTHFYEYVKRKILQQVAHGIYVSEDTWIDAMFLLHLRCGQAVFSHESALFLP